MTSGILRGIEDGWFMAEIADSAFIYQQALEKGTEEDRRGQRPHRHRSRASWRSCASRTRSSSSSARSWPSAPGAGSVESGSKLA